MKTSRLSYFAVALLLTATCFAQDQDTGLGAIQQWLRQQVEDASRAKKEQAATTAAKKKPAQTQSISIDRGSTTLVDQSSGADLVSGALNLLPFGGGQGGSGTVSASLYSLYALGMHQDPLKPTFYNANSGLRKMFFTVGREEQQVAGEPSQSTPGIVYGVKFLPVNKRDASSISQETPEMADIANVAAAFAREVAAASGRIATLLSIRNGTPSGAPQFAYLQTLTLATLPDELNRLGKEDRASIDAIVQKYVADDARIDGALETLVARLRRRYQISFAFQTTQRKNLSDDYRIAFILDRGFGSSLFFTFNADYNYSNSINIGADVRGARAAVDLRWTLAQPPARSVRSPLQLALSGEGLRNGERWEYRTQLQLLVPIATGVNLPVSFGYGNRPDLLRSQEKDIYGKFGVTFDLGKAVDALRGSK
jgi:hypothetical protein